ncbi:hypothetical protein [Sphingomonas oryzagri]|uniref:Uncharacterized protein n=1 Tax=Sphingomonas oryzagri TaxID=3042314 RepID=A0ABT6N7R2_9SPHN|nr:hypothetical protein [Sphingomonas oryzagri]MDH7641133.1 hypothetical protein [Sphingomonas oryzagri]
MASLKGEPLAHGSPLSEMAPVQAATASLRVGLTDLYGGNHPLLRDLGTPELVRARERGFEILADWPNGFRNFLDNLYDQKPCGGFSVRFVYGEHLFYWLRNADISIEPLRRELRQHFLRNAPRRLGQSSFGGGAKVEPNSVTLSYLATVSGRDVKTIIKVAKHRKFVDTDHPTPSTLISNKHAKELIADFADSVGVADAVSLMGLTKVGFLRLRRSVQVPGRLSYRHYVRSALIEFVGLVGNGTGEVGIAPPRAATIPDAAKSTKISTEKIVKAIVERRLRPLGRLKHTNGISSILVNLDDVRKFVRN